MCGIAGFSGSFEKSLLSRMSKAIEHRGPDDSGSFFSIEKGIGLAHRRLSIIDLTADGHQPMWDATTTVAIVFNGEIYNYRELRNELIRDGFQFNSHSDTEVILNLYLRDGVKLLEKLNGIFAFAIWDPRSDSLFLARDGVGVKPFYYSTISKGFIFASEIKSLLQEPSIDRALDHKAIHHHLTYLWSPAPDTILKHVKKLNPGQAIVVKNGVIKKHWQYYDLPYDQAIENYTAEEAIEQVRSHLSQAVARQMVADVPVGAFLSGGLDSSALVALSKQSLKTDRSLQCFTIGFNDDSFKKEGMADDLPYAQKVADHLGVDLHTIYVGPEMTDHLQRMIYHLDEPQADPAPLNALFISELAKQHGIKVLLSGAGGDDIFSGYRRHNALQLERYWRWLPQSLRQLLTNLSSSIPQTKPFGRRLRKAFKYASLNGNERIASYFYWSSPETVKNLFSQNLQDELYTGGIQEPLVASLRNINQNTPPLNKMLYLEGKHFLADHNLNYTDKMGMAAGVEVRVPLLDPDLVALAARLPVNFKQNGQIGKWIFKKAMEPYLPHNVIYRPKTGFGAPLRFWMRQQLRPLIDDVLSTSSLKQRGLFDPGTVESLMKADRDGRVDGTYTIFSLLCIELWCEIFLDGNRNLL